MVTVPPGTLFPDADAEAPGDELLPPLLQAARASAPAALRAASPTFLRLLIVCAASSSGTAEVRAAGMREHVARHRRWQQTPSGSGNSPTFWHLANTGASPRSSPCAAVVMNSLVNRCRPVTGVFLGLAGASGGLWVYSEICFCALDNQFGLVRSIARRWREEGLLGSRQPH